MTIYYIDFQQIHTHNTTGRFAVFALFAVFATTDFHFPLLYYKNIYPYVIIIIYIISALSQNAKCKNCKNCKICKNRSSESRAKRFTFELCRVASILDEGQGCE